MAQGLYGALATFLAPLLMELDARIDKRLVRTFLNTVAVILTFRDRVNGLRLSEMGGYLDTPDKAPAGTKRLSRLLHCVKWSAELIKRVPLGAGHPPLAEVERGRGGGAGHLG
jgi:hypothetical protein